MVQIRDVPEDLHRLWRVRAAARRQSLSDYLLAELQQISSRPTMEEWLMRVRSHPPVHITSDMTAIIREERDRR